MIEAGQLAGFFAAHAIWSVSEGETLIPMLGQLVDGEATLERLDDGDFEQTVTAGRARLADDDASAAALLYDANVEIDDESVDAIVIEIRSRESPESEVVMAIPYTPATSGSFAVHRPKLLAWTNCDRYDVQEFLTSFFSGVDGHEQGARIWNQHLDESR